MDSLLKLDLVMELAERRRRAAARERSVRVADAERRDALLIGGGVATVPAGAGAVLSR